MKLRLHNTLTRSTETLFAEDGKTVRFYGCGPTVYGAAHIGNFRTFAVQDMFRRVLELSGQPTFHVRNITDVDDKTIRQSQAEGRALLEFTQHWAGIFNTDCQALNCLPPHEEASAIAHIPGQIKLIQTLIEKEHAYVSEDGSVYYNVQSFPQYGKLSRLDTRELKLGTTSSTRPQDADEYEKDNLADFALWKAHKPEDGENKWESPWGPGRPGWHTECCAICLHHFGQQMFDVHSGGVDLVFPHHDNEIAQAEAATGNNFARHWFHITHLLVDGKKMSKSLGNMYTLGQLLEHGHQPMHVRYALLAGHYRQQLNFTFESVHAAASALEKLAKTAARLLTASELETLPTYAETCAQADALNAAENSPLQPAWHALLDDLNVPKALGEWFSALKNLQASDTLAFARLVHALGLELNIAPYMAGGAAVEAAVPENIATLGQRRWEAKQSKNWAQADTLRDELAALGWESIDGKDGFKLQPKK